METVFHAGGQLCRWPLCKKQNEQETAEARRREAGGVPVGREQG
jgi:hypothetical protein